jgi:dienelactone hydrolase
MNQWAALLLMFSVPNAGAERPAWMTSPPPDYAAPSPGLRSPLIFNDGRAVTTAEDWHERRKEILTTWHSLMGEWPSLVEQPSIRVIETTQREMVSQQKVLVQVAPAQSLMGYLLRPAGTGPHPAVFVPFYDPETSAGLSEKPHRDFAWQLAKRGFVTLCLGSPGGDARRPVMSEGSKCQPLSYLAYIGANAWHALASLPEVNAQRIGIVGHSYGGKWALFASCLFDQYACAAWSDAGVVFDETRSSINYQEPWYLGLDSHFTRQPGLVTATNPRTGAYSALIQGGHNLHELHALMAPRPFLVSGGVEDPPKRWSDLFWAIKVNELLGHNDRVAMTHRPEHSPNDESNASLYAFLEHWLK